MSVVTRETTFLGYRRENGRVGVRNLVIVLPLDDLSNSAAALDRSSSGRTITKLRTPTRPFSRR